MGAGSRLATGDRAGPVRESTGESGAPESISRRERGRVGQVARSENRMAMPWSRHRVDGVQGVICHGQRSAAESDSQKGINSLRVTWVTCPEGR